MKSNRIKEIFERFNAVPRRQQGSTMEAKSTGKKWESGREEGGGKRNGAS